VTVIAARERRARIAELVAESDRVDVASLTAQFGLSDASIRRDLLLLEGQGRLKRIHGGAIAPHLALRQGVYATKIREHRDEKRRIAAAAADLIRSSDVVLFDSGTTVAFVVAHVAPALRSRSSITAATHSLPVLVEMGSWDGPHLVALGGLYLPDYEAFVGPQTVASLKGLSADIAFLGCDGLTIEAGITTPHVLVAEVGATMAARARRVIALADSSKLGRPGFTTIVGLDQVDVLITDTGALPEQLLPIRSAGIEVIIA
jgi:DeoR/GlpR family transcriptional regulator of sugar metabolism